MNTTQSNNENLSSNQTFKAACLGACEKFAAQVGQAKDKLVAEFKGVFENHEPLLQHAINQADALAWETGYPHLLFPVLAAEKVQAAARWQARQQFLLGQSGRYALAA